MVMEWILIWMIIDPDIFLSCKLSLLLLIPSTRNWFLLLVHKRMRLLLNNERLLLLSEDSHQLIELLRTLTVECRNLVQELEMDLWFYQLSKLSIILLQYRIICSMNLILLDVPVGNTNFTNVSLTLSLFDYFSKTDYLLLNSSKY